MEDRENPDWRVVIRHDPRSRRREGEREYMFFEVGGAVEEANLLEPAPLNNAAPGGVEVEALHVNAVDTSALEADDDFHLGDLQYGTESDEDC